MAFSIKNKAVERAMRRLPKPKNSTSSGAASEPVGIEYWRVRDETPLMDRLGTIAAHYREFPETGLAADKAFFDEMSSDE
jgi:antitoxin VapB